MHTPHRLVTAAALTLSFAACRAPDGASPGSPQATVTVDSMPAVDTAAGERPDTVPAPPVDSTTVMLALLPADAQAPLDVESAALAERAVFAPRTQRWFMARLVDSAPAVDIGRIDDGVGSSSSARAALVRMLAARSPIQPGMPFTLHGPAGAMSVTVADLRVTGRRIVARLNAPAGAILGTAMPVEWRGMPPRTPRRSAATACDPGDTTAISAAVARYTPSKDTSVSVVYGCFGTFRALIAIRPLAITPETIEKVVLVRSTGKTRSGRLRDLSYPLHELISVLDVDGDGTHEIIVHSVRPAMETWAALRMTDSVSFARFASGFTVETR